MEKIGKFNIILIQAGSHDEISITVKITEDESEPPKPIWKSLPEDLQRIITDKFTDAKQFEAPYECLQAAVKEFTNGPVSEEEELIALPDLKEFTQ